jgi:hypothetical protein
LISKQGSTDLYLECGDYSYPFQIVLPPNLPTSFEHMYGRVRYSIYGTIDIPWAFDKHTTRSFSVISHLDLNALPNLHQPFGVSDTKVLCCGICKSDPIIAYFSLMKCGYVPGEGILFNVNLDNKSNRTIDEMTVNLKQNIRFYATTKSKSCIRNVGAIRFPRKIPSRFQDTWNDSVLVIPPVCSTSNGTCGIIEVSYSIVFNFDTSGIAISKDLVIPIVVGTIPLKLSENNHYDMPAPPSYEACMFPISNGQIPDDVETKGEVVESDSNTFKPFYPYYKDFSIRTS